MISVVIPLYNKETSIKQSLMSVLSQSYQDFEVVIVDDGSTDHSTDVVEGIKDFRIRLIRQENGGPSKARNTGVKNAKGEWIVFLDADDELLPDALSVFCSKIKANPAYSFFCAPYYVHVNDAISLACHYKEQAIRNPFKNHCFGTLMSRAGAFICKTEICKSFLFDERLRRYEDFEWLCRIYNHVTIYVFSEPVLKMHWNFSAASQPRKNIKEDFMGYLEFKDKSFWEKIAIYNLYLGERDYYGHQCKSLYPWLCYRYDWLLFSKIIGWLKRLKVNYVL